MEDKDYEKELVSIPRENNSKTNKTYITTEFNQINYRGKIMLLYSVTTFHVNEKFYSF